MKKGVSVIVSSILLITFVVVLGLIVMGWGSGLVKKSITRSETRIGSELECSDVNLKLEKVQGSVIIIKNNNLKKDLAGYIVRIITEEKVFVDDETKIKESVGVYSADVYNYEDNAFIKGLISEGIDINVANIKKLEVIPRIDIDEGEIVDCTNKIGAYCLDLQACKNE